MDIDGDEQGVDQDRRWTERGALRTGGVAGGSLAGRRFRDRREAGQALARLVVRRAFERPAILGIATGGVALAAEVAEALGADLGVVVARKLEAPYQPGLTLGAVTADGFSWINGSVAEAVGAGEGYLAAEIRRRLAEARLLERELGSATRLPLAGRTVVVVDEGIVTGARSLAALRSVKGAGAGRVAFAAAVGPPEAFCRVRGEAFETLSLVEDPRFVLVADSYDDFRPLGVMEIRRHLAAAARRSCLC